MDKELAELVAKALEEPRWSAPDENGSSQAAVGKCTIDVLELYPHQGNVAVDEVGSHHFVVTHLITYEKLELKGASWSLTFDDDGFGCAVADNLEETIELLEDRFVYALHLSKPSNELVIVSRTTGSTGQAVHLKRFMNKFQSGALTTQLGATHADIRFELNFLSWPKMPAAKVMWSSKSIYTGLGFNQFKGQQWRWVDASWRRWQSVMHEYGLGEHVVPSAQMKDLLCCLSGTPDVAPFRD
jgi:hypothetical protein